MTGLYTADAESTLVQTTRLLLLLSLASLLLILAVVIVVLRQMLRPVQRVARAADEVASGNLEIQLDVSRHDEIGLLAGSFQTMTENLRAIIAGYDYMLDEMRRGKFLHQYPGGSALCRGVRAYPGFDTAYQPDTQPHIEADRWRGQSCLFWVRAGICRRSVYGAGRHGAGIRPFRNWRPRPLTFWSMYKAMRSQRGMSAKRR